MSYRYATIEREYGSGGTEIARRAAEIAGISCYGEEILHKVCEEMGAPLERAQELEEQVTGSFMYSVFRLGALASGKTDSLSDHEKLFVLEQQVIHRMAEEGPAIFVGHCSGEALASPKDALRVFICADEAFKRKRTIEEYGIAEERADAVRKGFDRKRRSYYKAFTLRSWENPGEYDLILDSSRLSIETCARILVEAMK